MFGASRLPFPPAPCSVIRRGVSETGVTRTIAAQVTGKEGPLGDSP